MGVLRNGKEVKVVGVLEDLLSQIGLSRWQGGLEIRDRFALTPVQFALYLQDEDVSAPTVLNGVFGIPEALFGILDEIQNADVVTPGQLCNSLLHNWPSRPTLSESPHIFEVS